MSGALITRPDGKQLGEMTLCQNLRRPKGRHWHIGEEDPRNPWRDRDRPKEDRQCKKLTVDLVLRPKSNMQSDNSNGAQGIAATKMPKGSPIETMRKITNCVQRRFRGKCDVGDDKVVLVCGRTRCSTRTRQAGERLHEGAERGEVCTLPSVGDEPGVARETEKGSDARLSMWRGPLLFVKYQRIPT